MIRFDLINFKGERETQIALGGYSFRDGALKGRVNVLLCTVEGRDIQGADRGFLLTLSGETAIWRGGFQVKARARYTGTPEGGVFRYRSKLYTRLTLEEVRTLAAGKTFKLRMR